ncbi:hypothetical protein VTH82DRAFT_1658 [Thermothelomyces myriococcoides]
MPTLLEVLQRKNPDIIDHWAGASYSNTTSDRFDDVSLDDQSRAHVQEWKDFTFGSIYLAYGDILDKPLDATYRPAQTPSTTPTTIIDENGIDTLGSVWSCNIVRAPLKVAGPLLRSRPGMKTADLADTPDPTLAPKKISWKHPTDSRVSTNPDWAVQDNKLFKKYRHAHRDDPPKYLVYAVGDSKLTQKWKSAWLSYEESKCVVDTDPPYHRPGTPAPSYQKKKDIKDERVKPLKQLATYCRYGETRYGYLVTQTELVALRVRRIPGDRTAAIEYRAIPWSDNGPGKLTAHLAIWALGCMGMNDSHRAMEQPDGSPLPSMAKLTWWKEDKAKMTFTNVISQRVISAAEFSKLRSSLKVDVQTDDKNGMSPFNAFVAGPPVPDLAQKLANLSLDNNPPPAGGGKKPQDRPAAATTSSSKPPAGAGGGGGGGGTAAASKKAYTKCTIGKTTFTLKKDSKGNYAAHDSSGKAKYTIVQNAKKQWVVKEDSKLVVAKME